MPEALPAVTVPFLSNTGFSFAMLSMVASARGCSSVSNFAVPPLALISMGRIWSLKTQCLMASMARRWLSTAKAS